MLAFKRASSTVFGRLDGLGAAATSGAPHYFFSQTDDELSGLPGVPRSPSTARTPRAQLGTHIVQSKS